MVAGAQRQREYKKRLKESGLVVVSGFVHPHQRQAVVLLLSALRDSPWMMPGPLRDTRSGKLQKR